MRVIYASISKYFILINLLEINNRKTNIVLVIWSDLVYFLILLLYIRCVTFTPSNCKHISCGMAISCIITFRKDVEEVIHSLVFFFLGPACGHFIEKVFDLLGYLHSIGFYLINACLLLTIQTRVHSCSSLSFGQWDVIPSALCDVIGTGGILLPQGRKLHSNLTTFGC